MSPASDPAHTAAIRSFAPHTMSQQAPLRHPTARRTWMMTSVIALASLAAGCASLLGPRTVEISREEILSKLGKRLPVTKRVMSLMDVSASLPALDLLEDQNRVSATVDLSATELFGQKVYKGSLTLSFGLRYEPKDLSIRLTDPRAESIRVDKLPKAYQDLLRVAGAPLLEEALSDFPIHQFKPEDLRQADRLGYEVQDIRVTRSGLAIRLAPRP